MLAPEAIPGFSTDLVEPYPHYRDMKGYRKMFWPSKDMICQEARRRDPLVKRLNPNNRSNEDMIHNLSERLGHLLTLEDKEFIIEKEKEMRTELIKSLAAMSETVNVCRVMGFNM